MTLAPLKGLAVPKARGTVARLEPTLTKEEQITVLQALKLLVWHVEQIRKTGDELPGIERQLEEIERNFYWREVRDEPIQ